MPVRRKSINVTTLVVFLLLVILAIFTFIAFGLSINGNQRIGTVERVTTAFQDTVTIWVNAGGMGSDNNSGLAQTLPVKSIGRALLVLQSYSAKECIIELDGVESHDFGTDQILNFFPLISLYGNIIIRGRRSNVKTGRVLQVIVSEKGHRFVSLGTNATGSPADLYQKHFVVASDGTFFIVENSTPAGMFNLVGGNYQGALNPETWFVDQTFTAFTTFTQVRWSGALQLLASYSRVCFESIEFIPNDAESQIVAPVYRDDGLVFKACRFTGIKNAASVAVPISRTGETGIFPLVLDKRALFRGSIYLNGGYIEGSVINAAFTTQQLDTKIVLYSVWMKNAHMSCVSMCNILGMFSENPQEVAVHTQSSHFFIQGLKVRGTCTDPNCQGILIRDSVVFDIANINIEYDGPGLGGIFFDSHSSGLMSVIDITLDTAPFAIRFGENIVARISNATLTAQYPISSRTTNRISLVNYHEYFPVGITTPALFFERNDRIWMGGGTFILHWNTSNVAPIFLGHASMELIGATQVLCTAKPTFPCIEATAMTDIHIFVPFINQNGVTPNNVIKLGANAIGPLVTQTDFAEPMTQLCRLYVGG